jgi:hypothetical protein
VADPPLSETIHVTYLALTLAVFALEEGDSALPHQVNRTARSRASEREEYPPDEDQ